MEMKYGEVKPTPISKQHSMPEGVGRVLAMFNFLLVSAPSLRSTIATGCGYLLE
jgi:hypothetical protein